MPSPLPDELRERVVQAYLSGDESFEAVAQRFSVGSASVKRWVRLKRTKGTISAKPHVGRTGHFILSEDCFCWRDRALTAKEIAVGRNQVVSYGSCSFKEPREDLRALGML